MSTSSDRSRSCSEAEQIGEKTVDLCIWTDPGADIDDEVALWYLLKRKVNQSIVIFVGGKGSLEAWDEFSASLGQWRKAENVLEFANQCTSKTIPPERRIPKGMRIRPKNIIVIAPGIDNCLDYFDLSALKRVWYQGNLRSTNGHDYITAAQVEKEVDDSTSAFNDRGSEMFFNALPSQCVVNATTSRECYQPQNLFSERLMQDFQLPDVVRETVRQTVFKNLVGRMHPKHPYNSFAEGLINPKIKGGNYHLARQIFQLSGKVYPSVSDQLKNACKVYVDSLPTDRGEESTQFLIQISSWITAIIGREPLTSHGQLITSTCEDLSAKRLHEEFPCGYREFILTGIYSPAFDLLAMKKCVNYFKL